MVPEGWSQYRFEEITVLANGQVDPKVEPYASMRHIGPENISSNTGQILGTDICKNLGLISGKYEFDENSLVYSKIRPNLNKLCRPNFKGVCSADMYPIWAKNPEELSIDFFAYYMLSPHFVNYAVAVSMRTGMPKVNRSDLAAIRILLPPLLEQKKIAKILSTWDRAIEVTEKLLESSRQQKKSLMQQLLTGKKRLPGFSGEWERVILSKISDVIMGSSPKSEAYNNKSDGLPLLQGNADIKNRLSAPRVYTSQITKECMVDDVLLSVRAPVGEVSRSVHHACIGRGIAAIRAKEGACQDFVYQWLLHFEPKWQRLSQGSTFEAVNGNDIKTLHMETPSYREQQAIAYVLSVADKEIETLRKKLACLRQEKKALMQQLLTGKRRVKVDEAEMPEKEAARA